MPYRLLQPDGSFVESDVPGALGGNATLRIYGRLDCESAVNSLQRGYAKHRVFFANEEAAINAGFRPCGRCMHAQHTIWKAGPTGTAPYPWHITPKHPIIPE
jgi:hypothetical protein